MTQFQKLALYCVPAVFIVFTVPAAFSQDSLHRTVIDVPYAVQVESTVLQPGQYVIKIMGPNEPNVVNVYSVDEKKLVATIYGVPVYRSEEAVRKAADKTEFWFSAASTVRPRPVLAWFYPGSEMGIELVNSRPKKVKTTTEH